MAENPNHSLLQESLRHLKSGQLTQLGDTLRHEGLKKGVESGLYLAGQSGLGRTALSRLVGSPIDDPRLRTSVAGLELDGPVGLGPGWDKTGKTLLAWQELGARHMTIGGVTLFAQTGSSMPRLHTMDQAVGDHGTEVSLNSFGFWNPGAEQVVYNIQRQRELGRITTPIIVQVTLNKEFYERGNLHLVDDIVGMTVKKVLPVADAINLGLSSPNTEGMRQAQDAGDQFMTRVAAAARNAMPADRHIPIIFKGDGDGGEERLEYYCRWAQYRGEYFDAFELINTTALPHIKARYGVEGLPGGVAGADPEYQQMMLDAVRYVYEGVGDKVDIIATGGVGGDPAQALKALEHGASAVGVNSAVRKYGLGVMRLTERGLLGLLDQKYPGISSLDQVIGSATGRGPKSLKPV